MSIPWFYLPNPDTHGVNRTFPLGLAYGGHGDPSQGAKNVVPNNGTSGGPPCNTDLSMLAPKKISGRLSVVLVRAKPHKGYVTKRVRRSSAYCQSLASSGMENLVTLVTGSAERHPEILYFSLSLREKNFLLLLLLCDPNLD